MCVDLKTWVEVPQVLAGIMVRFERFKGAGTLEKANFDAKIGVRSIFLAFGLLSLKFC